MGEPVKVDLVNSTVMAGLFGMVVGYCGLYDLKDKGTSKFKPVIAACRGGAGVGVVALGLLGTRNYLIEKRGVEDAYTTIGATCVSAAASALLTRRGPPRARMALVMEEIVLSVPLKLIIFNWIGVREMYPFTSS